MNIIQVFFILNFQPQNDIFFLAKPFLNFKVAFNFPSENGGLVAMKHMMYFVKLKERIRQST